MTSQRGCLFSVSNCIKGYKILMGSFCKTGSLFLQKMGSNLTIGSFLLSADNNTKLTNKFGFVSLIWLARSKVVPQL